MTEMSTLKFWEEITIPDGQYAYRFIKRTAWRSFPRLHEVVHRPIDVGPDRSKTKVLKTIGLYLSRSKALAKLICEYLYGKSGATNAVPKREREFDIADIHDIFDWFRVVHTTTNAEICESAALKALLSFQQIDEHYTYTLKPNGSEIDAIDNVDEDEGNEDESDEVLEVDIENQPCFDTITYFFREIWVFSYRQL